MPAGGILPTSFPTVIAKHSRILRWSLCIALSLNVVDHNRMAYAYAPPFASDTLGARLGHDVTVDELAAILREEGHPERWLAIRTAEEFGPDARPLVPLLVIALADEDHEIGRSAMRSL